MPDAKEFTTFIILTRGVPRTVTRIWRNWQTRMIQVHVGNHAGSSPVIRTNKKKAVQNSTAFFLPFRIAERLEPAVQPPGRRAPPFWRLLPPFPPLSGGIYLSSAPKRTPTQAGRRSFCVFKNDRTCTLGYFCVKRTLFITNYICGHKSVFAVLNSRQCTQKYYFGRLPCKNSSASAYYFSAKMLCA